MDLFAEVLPAPGEMSLRPLQNRDGSRLYLNNLGLGGERAARTSQSETGEAGTQKKNKTTKKK